MNFEKYIDIPYKHLGRYFDGADCWGLVWLIYKEEKNIILPNLINYKEFWYKEKKENYLVDNINTYNTKIEINYPFNIFDVLFFFNKSRDFVDHVGMIVSENRFIHTYRNNSSKIDRLEGYWKSLLWKGYRWQK